METSLDLRIEDGQLICNANNYANAVSIALKKYNYVVCSDNQEQAKKDKALLNKQLDEIKKCRLDFEKEYLSTWNQHKKILMDTEKEIKATSDKLGEQLNQLDELEKSNKREIIKGYFNEFGIKGLDFELIFKDKWLNKSCKDKEWQEDIETSVKSYKEAMELIKTLDLEDDYVIIEAYQKSLDFIEAKNQYNAYISNKRRSESFKQDNTNTQSKQESVSNQAKTTNNNELITTIVELVGTQADLDKLLEFINTQTSIKVQPYEK